MVAAVTIHVLCHSFGDVNIMHQIFVLIGIFTVYIRMYVILVSICVYVRMCVYCCIKMYVCMCVFIVGQ